MIDAISVPNLVSYSVQLLCIVALASVAAALFRIDAAGVRYAYWRGVGLLCLALPWIQPWPRITAPRITRINADQLGFALDTGARADQTAAATSSPQWELLFGILAAGIVVRLVWLCAGFAKLRQLRRAGEPCARCDDHDDLQRVIGTRAEVRDVECLRQPVTFGILKPVVLLPSLLRDHPLPVRRAVLAHELLHVERRDWAWVLVEEMVRTIFWFHPGVWWLISNVQLAREEVVDELAVLATGQRRTYVEALLAFADETPLAPAPAFARRRHLFHRMMLISKEAVMSPRQIVVSCAVMALIVAGGGWYAVRAFPLVGVAQHEMIFSPRPQEATSTERLHKGPGPLERKAVPITPENPVPRRVNVTEAEYPAEAAAQRATAMVRLQITLDELGRIAEVRVAGYDLRFAEQRVDDQQARRRVLDGFVESAATAVRQWRYEPPHQAPISFPVTISFSLGATEGSAGIPPPPPPAPPAPQTGRSTTWTGEGTIRVGGGVKTPTKIKDVRPVYPPVARDAGIQGVVILEVVIGKDGRVTDARVLRSIPLLDHAALDAVAQWEFTPTLVNGEPTAVVMTTTVNFTLQ